MATGATKKKADQTKIVFDSREDLPVVNGKEINVPTWFVSVVKLTIPAIIVAIGAYFKIQYLEQEVDRCGATSTVQEKRINSLEYSYGLLELKQDKDFDRIKDSLLRIEVTQKEQYLGMQTQMGVIQADVKDLQQRFPRKVDP